MQINNQYYTIREHYVCPAHGINNQYYTIKEDYVCPAHSIFLAHSIFPAHSVFPSERIVLLFDAISNIMKNRNAEPFFFKSFKEFSKRPVYVPEYFTQFVYEKIFKQTILECHMNCLLKLTIQWIENGNDFDTCDADLFQTEFTKTFYSTMPGGVIKNAPNYWNKNISPKIEQLKKYCSIVPKIESVETCSCTCRVEIGNDFNGFIKGNNRFGSEDEFKEAANKLSIKLSKMIFCVYDVHKIIKTDIYHVLASINKIPENIIENFPYSRENITFNYDNIKFATMYPFNIPSKRIGLVMKRLSDINFSECDDIHYTIYGVTKKESVISNKIPKHIIENFPCGRENITINNDNIEFTEKDFFLGRIDLVVNILSSINFSECDDIHLAIYDKIIEIKEKLQFVGRPFEKLQFVGPSMKTVEKDLFDFPEHIIVRAIERYINSYDTIIVGESGNFIDLAAYGYWIYPGEENDLLYKIIFKNPSCILCNGRWAPDYSMKTRYGYGIVGSSSTNEPFICQRTCNNLVRNFILADSTYERAPHIGRKYMQLRWLKNKVLLFYRGFNDMNSDLNMLLPDIVRTIISKYLVVIKNQINIIK